MEYIEPVLKKHPVFVDLTGHFVGYLAVSFMVMLTIGVILEFFRGRR